MREKRKTISVSRRFYEWLRGQATRRDESMASIVERVVACDLGIENPTPIATAIRVTKPAPTFVSGPRPPITRVKALCANCVEVGPGCVRELDGRNFFICDQCATGAARLYTFRPAKYDHTVTPYEVRGLGGKRKAS